MAASGLLLGVLHIILYAVILALVVWIIIYAAGWLGFPLPDVIQKLLWAIVALLVIIALVALLLTGVPPFRFAGITDPGCANAAASALDMPELLSAKLYACPWV